MADCPWYVTANAVRKYIELRRRTIFKSGRSILVGVELSFDDASDELISYAAETWQRYLADPTRRPKITNTGAYTYRGPAPLRLTLIVSAERRSEGPKGQVVDLLPTHEGLRHPERNGGRSR